MTATISATEFLRRLDSGEACCVLDVRTVAEWREVRLQGSHHIPLNELSSDRVREAQVNAQENVYVVCKAGGRARQAAERLKSAGMDKVVVVDGGLDACVACGARVTRGEVIPLERQVRIVAGALVLIGFLVGAMGFPIVHYLSALVGVALIVSGVTGWCGVAMLLAKAPWNRS